MTIKLVCLILCGTLFLCAFVGNNYKKERLPKNPAALFYMRVQMNYFMRTTFLLEVYLPLVIR
jgi:hypothetical protein